MFSFFRKKVRECLLPGFKVDPWLEYVAGKVAELYWRIVYVRNRPGSGEIYNYLSTDPCLDHKKIIDLLEPLPRYESELKSFLTVSNAEKLGKLRDYIEPYLHLKNLPIDESHVLPEERSRWYSALALKEYFLK